MISILPTHRGRRPLLTVAALTLQSILHPSPTTAVGKGHHDSCPIRPESETMRDETLETARDGILRTLEEWRLAVRAGDAEHLAELVSENAEFWSQETPPLEGRHAVAGAFRAFFELYEVDQQFECDELLLSDEWAFLRGTEVNRLVPHNGDSPIVVRQRAFSLLRLSEDGRWRFHRGMTHRPPPADPED